MQEILIKDADVVVTMDGTRREMSGNAELLRSEARVKKSA